MSTHFDVVVVGAGPVGIATATTLKSINKNLNICVIDKREIGTRSHGLKIQGDAVKRITEVMQKALKDSPESTHASLSSLMKIFTSWKNGFVRTTTIESDLAQKAAELGIEVLRGKDYELTEERMAKVMRSPEEIEESLRKNEESKSEEYHTLSEQDQRLMRIFQQAKVVVGADSAHSVIRDRLMGSHLEDVSTMQHILELKYQTTNITLQRKTIEMYDDSCYHGHFALEAMNQRATEESKPATFRVFVNKETYDAFNVVKEGKLKGIHGNAWTLSELKELSDTDRKVKKVYDHFIDYLHKVEKRRGMPFDVKITTLPLRVYRSSESAKLIGGRVVALAGDANSGLILERGFNKGLMEAGMLAETISKFYSSEQREIKAVPKEFLEYQEKSRELFANEKWWAEFKSSWITAIMLIFEYSARQVQFLRSITSARILSAVDYLRDLVLFRHVDAKDPKCSKT